MKELLNQSNKYIPPYNFVVSSRKINLYRYWYMIERRINMKVYDKIEAIFSRSFETKKTQKGVYNNPAVEVLKDSQWIGTEKIDGTNIRVHWDGYSISFAGRTDKAQIPPLLLKYLKEKFDCHELFEQIFGGKDVILFGEGYGKKINGNYLGKEDVDFILFDVYINGLYLERKAVEEIASLLNVKIVPITKQGTLDELVELVEKGFGSYLNKEVTAEGIVARPLVELRTNNGKRVITKIKYRDLHEKGGKIND